MTAEKINKLILNDVLVSIISDYISSGIEECKLMGEHIVFTFGIEEIPEYVRKLAVKELPNMYGRIKSKNIVFFIIGIKMEDKKFKVRFSKDW